MKFVNLLIFKRFFCFLLVFLAFCTVFCFANDKSIASFKLENGLEVFVIQDDSTPLVDFAFIVKAGYSVQTKESAGFAKVLSDVVFNSKNEIDFESLGTQKAETQIFNDYVLFNFETTQSSLEGILRQFSGRIKNLTIKDETLKIAFNDFAKTESEKQKYATNLIDAAMDAKIFYSNPWQKETGTNTQALKNLNIQDIRYKITKIFEENYIPKNSAIFICGNILSQKGLQLVNKYFADWENPNKFVNGVIAQTNGTITGASAQPQASVQSSEKAQANTQSQASAQPQASVQSSAKAQANTQKKYVIVSDDFSADFNQFIIHFEKENNTNIYDVAVNELSALALESSANYKNAVLKSQIGLTDFDYIYSGISDKGNASRVMVQGLLESNKNPISQLEVVLQSLENGKILREEDLSFAKKQILTSEKNIYASSKNLMNAACSVWHYGGVEWILQYPSIIEQVSLDEVQSVYKTEPYIFVALNSSIYKKYSSQLQKNGFSVITNKNAFWFQNAQYDFDKVANETNATSDLENQNSELENVFFNQNSDFFKNNINTFSEAKLSNGIKVFSKSNNFGNNVAFRLCILGGESFSEFPGLETIVVKILEKNILKNIAFIGDDLSADFSINSETDLYKSNITINCATNDLEKILHCVSDALFFDDVTSVLADEVFYLENYNWRINKLTAQNQMLRSTFEALFSGTKIEKYFTVGDTLLLGARFTNILSEYAKLFDSSRFVFYACGNLPLDFDQTLDKEFSALKQITNPAEYASKNCVEPSFYSFEMSLNLSRIFKSDLTVEEVGDSIPILIPTTVFEDPAIFCFEGIPYDDERFPQFCAVMHFFENQLVQKYQKNISVKIYNYSSPFVVVEFSKVSKKSDVDRFFINEFNNLQTNIKSSSADFIKYLYEINEFTSASSKETMIDNMQRGHFFANDVSKFLKDYNSVQNSSLEDFAASVDFLVGYESFIKIFSKDTK